MSELMDLAYKITVTVELTIAPGIADEAEDLDQYEIGVDVENAVCVALENVDLDWAVSGVGVGYNVVKQKVRAGA